MRAVYLENIKVELNSEMTLSGDVHKHLSKVVRIKKGEEIKILNGLGVVAQATVLSVEKRETVISISNMKKNEGCGKFNLIVGLTKKEALEEILRKSVELGVRSLRFVETEYSQKNQLKEERVQNILESAYCQSNNPWKLKLDDTVTFETLEILLKEYPSSCLMSLRGKDNGKGLEVHPDSALLIGPEGGFTEEEENQLIEWGAEFLRFETPIMRAPTAAVAGIGFLHSISRS